MDFFVPLNHLYISRVKCSSFLYHLSTWQKEGEIVEIYGFFLKILYVRRRNTCLYKGEMCFILLGGMPISFFLYTGLVTMFTYICAYLWWCMSSSPILTCVISHKDVLMSFVLKCFWNTGCQSLLAINSLLAKFFKSLC